MLKTPFAVLLMLTTFTFQSCQPSSPGKKKTDQPIQAAKSPQAMTLSVDPYSQPISIDTGNKMIQSYLTSIGYPPGNVFLRSMIVNADTLRNYINDTTNGKIVNVKLMLAHQLAYINSGNYGVRAGTKKTAFALVLVGLDGNGRYIYNRNNMVYEHFQPCPDQCVENSSNLLTQ